MDAPAEDRYAKPLAYEPGRLVRGFNQPIRVGRMLLVFTDPHRGHEFAVAASRWVATRQHKDVGVPERVADELW